MKRFLSLTLSLVLLLGLCCGFAFAADSTKVYVTIADKNGLALVQEATSVTDIDSDGKITINDALYCAHESFFAGGAAEGYLSEMGDYGLSLKKLWGVDNGTGYGYYVNNASAWSLADEVKEGDHITAFIYTDTTNWSDSYSYFDKNTAKVKVDEEIELTLSSVGFDADYNAVVSPVAGATIIIGGAKSDIKTDENGKFKVSFHDAASYTLSASSDSLTLVPPSCIITVEKAAEQPPVDQPGEDTPQTGDTASLLILAIVAVVALGGVIVIVKHRHSA
jgi:hypothetical protein